MRDISGASGRVDEGNENLVYASLWDFKSSFTRSKILRYSTSGFTSHPKGRCAADSYCPKNPSPWPGLNPQPLGPVTGILTTRRHITPTLS
jgi:hypothetical protein